MNTHTTDKKTYHERIQSLASKIDGSIGVIFSNKEVTRSHDTNYPFRQKSHLDYLTGFPEANSALVIATRPSVKSYLFVQNKNPRNELWEGERFGLLQAKKHFAVDETLSISDFEAAMVDLLQNHHGIYIDLFEQKEEFDQKIYTSLQALSFKKKTKTHIPLSILDISPLIGRMRLKKSEEEIKLIKKACKISSKAHRAAMAFSEPGKYEYQVQALMEYVFKTQGASGPAYESIVASGNNANTLHYITNREVLQDGDCLLIDAGCEYKNYASDITRTFPINGKYSEAARDIYSVVLKAQKVAIEMIRPGENMSKIHERTARTLIDGLIDLKVFSGSTQDIYDSEDYRTFFPHGTGHWLGLDVHDQCPYLEDETLEDIILEPGMVFTVEPGLYFSKETENTPQVYKGIGVRIEDDILVTDKGYSILSQDTPKEIDEIEKACREDYRSFL